MSNGSDSSAMDPKRAGWLALYLVFFTITSGYSVYSLWSLNSPSTKPGSAPHTTTQTQPPNQTAPNQTAPGQPAPNPGAAQTSANPETAKQAAPDTGKQAGQGTSQPAAPGAGTNPQAGQGAASQQPNQGTSQPQQQAPSPTANTVYAWTWLGLGPDEITGEAQLLLLVLFMGMFGSSVYALKSLGDYRGDNKLASSWRMFYLIQPFEGSGIALLMYLVVRGGFLSGTNAGSDSINKFGICAIAGLSGAFSDTAFMKLNEVFDTLFKPKDNRGGKIDAFAISTPTPLPDGKVGTAYSVTLKTANGVGTQTWSVTPALPAGLNLGAATGVIIGTPSAARAATDYNFTVKDSANPQSTATKPLSLTITT
jgi:Putative Ig domain